MTGVLPNGGLEVAPNDEWTEILKKKEWSKRYDIIGGAKRLLGVEGGSNFGENVEPTKDLSLIGDHHTQNWSS